MIVLILFSHKDPDVIADKLGNGVSSKFVSLTSLAASLYRPKLLRPVGCLITFVSNSVLFIARKAKKHIGKQGTITL